MIPNSVPIRGGNDFRSEPDQSGRNGLVEVRRKYSCEEKQLSVAPQPCALPSRQRKEAAAVGAGASGNFLNCRWAQMIMGALGTVQEPDTRSGCVGPLSEGM